LYPCLFVFALACYNQFIGVQLDLFSDAKANCADGIFLDNIVITFRGVEAPALPGMGRKRRLALAARNLFNSQPLAGEREACAVLSLWVSWLAQPALFRTK